MLWTTRSAVSVRGVSSRVCRDVTDGPRPKKSPLLSCRTTGHDRNVFLASIPLLLVGPAAGRATCRFSDQPATSGRLAHAWLAAAHAGPRKGRVRVSERPG